LSEQSSRGAAWERTRLAVLDRDGWICTYCHKPLEGSDATVDHLIAKNHGGTDDPDNLVAACRRCNGRKSDRVGDIRLDWFNPAWLNGLP